MCSWGPVHGDACQVKESKWDRFPQERSVEWGEGGEHPDTEPHRGPGLHGQGQDRDAPHTGPTKGKPWSVLEALLPKTVSPEPSPPTYDGK